MQVRIYQPARTAMQSGQALTQWVVEFPPSAPRVADPLMGWTSSTDTQLQVKLKFDTKEEAIAYAEKQGLAYLVEEPAQRSLQTKAYADNFKFDRVGRWTH
ncbi:MAG TPA: ETC complex I subunit [Dongiaceae bacterium]